MRSRKIWNVMLSVIMIVVMCLGMTGCSNETSNGEEGTTVLKWVAYGDKPTTAAFDTVWEELNSMLKEDLNCKVEIEFLGWSDLTSQIQLRFASGTDDFDFCYVDQQVYSNLVIKNAFAELTDEMMQKNMPGVLAQVSENILSAGEWQGKMYALPNNTDRYEQNSVALRGDLREKYNLPVPESVDDVVEYMKVIAKNEGAMKGMMQTTSSFYGFMQSPNSQANLTGTSGTVFYDADKENEVYYKYTSEQWYDYVKLCRELVEAGVFSSDSVSDSRTAEDMFESGLTACYFHNVETCGMRALNCPEEWNIEVYSFNMDVPKAHKSPLTDLTVFNPNSKNLDLAMKVVDKFYSDKEYNELLMLGFEGKNWEDAGEGLYKDLDSTLPDDEQYKGNWYSSWCWVNKEVERWSDASYQGVNEQYYAYADNGIIHPLCGFLFDTLPVKTENANLTATASRYVSALEYGMVDDVDSYYQEFINELKEVGLETYMTEVKSQVSKYLSSN